MPLIPALREGSRGRVDLYESQVSMVYISSSKPAKATYTVRSESISPTVVMQ